MPGVCVKGYIKSMPTERSLACRNGIMAIAVDALMNRAGGKYSPGLWTTYRTATQ